MTSYMSKVHNRPNLNHPSTNECLGCSNQHLKTATKEQERLNDTIVKKFSSTHFKQNKSLKLLCYSQLHYT